MSFYPGLDNLSLDALIARFRGPSIEPKGYEQIYHDEIAYQMSERHGEEAVAFLLEELERLRDDDIRLGAVLTALEDSPPHHPFATQIYLYRLGDTGELILTRTIDGLAHLEVTKAHDRVLAHLSHPSPYVVGAVLRYLRQFFPEEARPILYKALRDERFIVRECAVDELDELGDVEAASLIRPLLDDPHPDMRQAARWYFAHLAGKLEQDEDAYPALQPPCVANQL
jgi:HEAT repeat protein